MSRKLVLVLLALLLALPAGMALPATAQEEVTITFWHHWGGNRVELMEEQVAAFEEANPGIKVDVVFLPWDNRLPNLLTAIAAGDPPDVTMFGRQDLPSFAATNSIIPLDDYMARDGITADMFIPAEFAGTQYNGQTWMLPQPTGGSLNIVWYDKDHVREAGLDPEAFPQTWDELKVWGEALVQGDGSLLDRIGIDVLHTGGDLPPFMMWLNANGQDWISGDLRTVTINNQAGIEVLEFMKSFTNDINYGVIEVTSFYEGGADLDNDIFFYGKETIQIDGSWVLFQLLEFAPDMDFGIAPVPYGPSGSPDRRGSTYGGWGYMIPQNSDNPAEAWELVKWLTTEIDGKGACWFIQQQQRPSPLVECDGYLKDGETHPRAAEILAIAELDHINTVSPVQPQVIEIILQMTDDVLYDDRPYEEALAWAEGEIQALLDAFWAEYE